MKKRVFTWIIITLTSTGFIILILSAPRYKPPVEDVFEAKNLIIAADKINADDYAADRIRKAKFFYDSAMSEWAVQNKKFYAFRNYSRVKDFSLQAAELAKLSFSEAEAGHSATENHVLERIISLEKKLKDYDILIGQFPLSDKQRADFSQGKILLHEAKISKENSNLKLAKANLVQAEMLIMDAVNYYTGILENYFVTYPEWSEWIKTSISESARKKNACIIVDKVARECFLYQNGRLTGTFPIELGTNWIGDKKFQGDKATPEGIYRVVSKKMGGDTKYYKALLINYPNEDDKQRFVTNKEKGIIQKTDKIGNLIEIHGHGGKGADWTDGCVALKDDDMDKLYKLLQAGSKVVIVGSTKALEEVL